VAVASGQTYQAAAEAAGRGSNDAVSQLVSRFNREALAALNHAMAVIRPSYTVLRTVRAFWPKRAVGRIMNGMARPPGR
jgi:hypothetical protein